MDGWDKWIDGWVDRLMGALVDKLEGFNENEGTNPCRQKMEQKTEEEEVKEEEDEEEKERRRGRREDIRCCCCCYHRRRRCLFLDMLCQSI